MKGVIMKHKIKYIAMIAALPLSFDSFAASEVLTGTFETIKAVSISEVPGKAIALEGLQLTLGDECDLVASNDGSGNGYVGDVEMLLGAAGNANAQGSAVTAMSGTGCIASTTGGAIGIYEIDGAEGATVTVTVVDGQSTELDFAPNGCVGNYVAGVDGDSCDTISDGTPAAVRLAGATDTGSLGEGTPVPGKTRVALGAKATARTALTASTPYTVDFDINVTY